MSIVKSFRAGGSSVSTVRKTDARNLVDLARCSWRHVESDQPRAQRRERHQQEELAETNVLKISSQDARLME
jgi:hypothetical protein